MHAIVIMCDGVICDGKHKFVGTYHECVAWIAQNIADFEQQYEDFYSLDILNLESGRLVSWVLR